MSIPSTNFLRETVSIEEIPQPLKDAFIYTEDKRFYKHNGHDLKRIIRASINNIKAKSFKEGASTISQQLIKNSHLTQEKTFKRKLREWKLTKSLEKAYTKDEILERYLNSIYFGHNCFGIASASRFYFAKSPSDLTLDECAILAGLVKAPNHYSPFKNPTACQKRKNIVLSAMLRSGAITQQEKTLAENTPIPVEKNTKREDSYLHFVFDELTDLSEKYSFKIGGKIEIYTYLDQNLQQKIEQIAEGYTESDKTFLVLDHQSHGFKACISTLGNVARLPGSLIKPLLVYAPAMEENLLSPATPILDAKIDYNGYSPQNYNGIYHGYISTRECIEKSLNIPAVKVLDSLTVKKGVEYLSKLNLPVCKEDQSLALALGGMQKGYPLKDILSAYASLPNEGVFTPCSFISSIRINGATVYRKTNPTNKVFSVETSALMTDMLKSTTQNGTAKKLRGLPFEVAGKTGTVGGQEGNTDAYALSYTTRDCAAVWLGNADNTKINHTGGGEPCRLLREINEAAYELYQLRNQSIKPFTMPVNTKKIELDKQAYYDTHTLLLADENSPTEYRLSEWFKTSAIPLNKSTSFSSPHIDIPTISLRDNVVCITFDKYFPAYYTYKIDRYDYATHTTLYQGNYLHEFHDNTLLSGKNYLYTITPIYNEKEGTPITLPIVSTKKGEKAELNHDILSNEGWEN